MGRGSNPPKTNATCIPLRKKALIAGRIKGQAGDVSSFFLGGWVPIDSRMKNCVFLFEGF